MKLNHLNLTVSDPVKTQEFLVKYFGLRPRGRPNDKIAILFDDNGMVLTVMNSHVGGEAQVRYPATFHIGFVQETEEEVDALNQRLKTDGFNVAPPSRQHGSWTFYFEAPGGFTIEVLS